MDGLIPIINPSQFQLPPGFQQLLEPIKQEPLDLQFPEAMNLIQPPPLVLQQATVKAKPKPRKKKIKKEPGEGGVTIEGPDGTVKKLKQEKITEHLTVKKKRDRFNGMPEEEVVLRLLPDHLTENLDIVIVGINPGLYAAYVGHHYAGPGNHFWKCLYLSGLVPEPMNAYQDHELQNFGIGFTNICARTTRGSADLKKTEIKEGAAILREKLKKYKPKIAAFNGKGIYEIYHGSKNFKLGKQPDPVEGTNTIVYVMPSSSARCAQLPRATDKVPFYLALKTLRDYANGDIKVLNEADVCFPNLELKIKTEPKTEPVDGEEAGDVKPNIGKAKPKAKSKAKKTKSNGQTSQEQNIPVPINGGLSANGMLPLVKQEKLYNASDYGGQVMSNMVSMPTQMPVYQNSHIYSQPVVQNNIQNVVPNQAASVSTFVPNTTGAALYPGAAQPMYQAPMFMSAPYVAAQNQSWQQYQTYPATTGSLNDKVDHITGGGEVPMIQIKSEPQEYGYTEISFNNM